MYSQTVHVTTPLDGDEVVGTAAETEEGLPNLPDSVTVVEDPLEDDVIPEQTAAERGGPDDPTVDVVKQEDAKQADRKENGHE